MFKRKKLILIPWSFGIVEAKVIKEYDRYLKVKNVEFPCCVHIIDKSRVIEWLRK